MANLEALSYAIGISLFRELLHSIASSAFGHPERVGSARVATVQHVGSHVGQHTVGASGVSSESRGN